MNKSTPKPIQRAGLLASLLVIALLVLAACQPAAPEQTPTSAPPPTTAPQPTEAMEATVAIPETGATPMATPLVVIDDQSVESGIVTVSEVVSDGPGWIVIHIQADDAPGTVIGFSPVEEGSNSDVEVEIDTALATPILYAMLHTDAGTVGTYEFPGADGPAMVEGQMVNPSFSVTGLPEAAPTEAAGSGTGTPAAPAAGTGGVEVALSESPDLGQFLVDGNGMTLYMFTKDDADQSNCAGECLANWPPLLTEGDPVAGEGVDASKLGTITLDDGSLMVTYNHYPLYYWVADKNPGETTGQNVGSVWFVLNPAGYPVGGPAEIAVSETPDLGQFLVDGNGMTLYMFTKDEADQSNCAGECLVNWPPFLTTGEPILGEGVDATKVGTTTLADGSTIVTYDHMPLYYWVNDKNPGDITGQGVGDVWFVVEP